MKSRLFRFFSLMFGLFYVLLSTQLLSFVAIKASPSNTTLIEANFPCSDHGCGCDTAEKCRAHCCCYPQQIKRRASSFISLAEKSLQVSRKEHRESKKEPLFRGEISYLTALDCLGQDPTQVELMSLSPHTFPEQMVLDLSLRRLKFKRPHSDSIYSLHKKVPTKVPIFSRVA